VGKQDYDTLVEYVKSKLPNEDFMLVAESFSGPIGVVLAQSDIPNLKAIVFVATFLSTPRRSLVKVMRHLPIKLFSKLPFATALYRFFMFGSHAPNEIVTLFQEVLSELPSETLKQRLFAIESLSLSADKIDLPAVYIRAEEDRLVSCEKCTEFKTIFSSLSVKTIKGPHFVIQTNPEECAEVINGEPSL
jgi:pimeloyl-ACP methyl ester carboxylesterase